jgi:MFS family permease
VRQAQRPVRTSQLQWPSTFAALRHRNYRLWFFGQTLSVMGTWAQSVAQGWTVYELTGSELALGIIQFFASLPTLFLMVPAGAIADRLPKRKLVMIAQVAMMLQAFALAALAATGALRVWHVAILAACNGVANSFDAPARHAMAVEMVEDRRDLANAVALNSTIFNTARMVGPAVAGIILARLGAAWCFGLNGVSFLAVILALLAMRLPAVEPKTVSESVMEQVRVGVHYIWRDTRIRTMVVLVGVGQLFGFFYSVLMPAYAVDVLRVGEAGLGNLNAAVGIGALVGSLTVASLGGAREKVLLLTIGAFLFPVANLLFSGSQSLVLSMLCLALSGVGFVTQNTTINTLIQSAVPDELRGRVMAVYILMFFGSTPFAALMAGALGQAVGVRAAIAIGSAITLGNTLYLFLRTPALRRVQA